MPIGNKQIGWSNESNLLWDISNQLDRLTKVIAANTGGGGGTNPTSTFMPFNNAGTFADSFLVNDTTNNVLKSVYSGNDVGLKLDFVNRSYYFGDYSTGNGTSFLIDDINNNIFFFNQGFNNGIYLDFGGNEYKFGNIPTTSFYFVSGIKLETYSNGNSVGFSANENISVKVGDWGNSIAGLSTTYNFSTNRIENYSGDGYYNFANVPEYADNAAALAALLIVGDIYRTGDNLKIVH